MCGFNCARKERLPIKTPTAKKLQSGNWRIQLQVDGKRYSCTGATKKEAQEKAKKLYAGIQMEKRSPLTVKKAFDKYIESKEGVLSPLTIRGYKSIRDHYFKDIMSMNLTDLTQDDIQIEIGKLKVAGLSPKTIRNAHGLINSVLKAYRPNLRLDTKLPQKIPYDARIFTEDEMQKVWNAAKGDLYELPILFASWLGLRMSEVRGLKFSDIQNGRIHIQRACIRVKEGSIDKPPKSTSGDRWIVLPEIIQNLVDAKTRKSEDSYICPWTDESIHRNFRRICDKAGVVPCRFHDLRHFAASEAHSLGIPDKYSMKRMGHKTDNMLKTVYEHTMREKEDDFAKLIDDKMSKLYGT